ncbi:DEAD/DEAH box helicase [OM182 bacterium]|jgi:ATP-dependent RNA helicase RhlE|nr:DEAD/DEAH box helicase [OM182 bacterium]
MTFSNLGLSKSLLQAVEKTGYTEATPIQQRAIPEILAGRDVMAAAQTGTGKTAGFTLPLLQLLSGRRNTKRYSIRSLVLTPTRELAAQIQESIEVYGVNENLRANVVFGGVNINPQKKALGHGTDILVATPGRLLDLKQQGVVVFGDLEVLILDEADRMLDMGFIRDIRTVLAMLPKRRQNLLFSATFSNEIRALAKSLCNNPVEIDVAPRNSTVEIISQILYLAEKDEKAVLLSLILRSNTNQTLVFSRTKHGANNLVKKLAKDGVGAVAIHGNKSQAQRTKALEAFKLDKVQVLVATDIAARGIDIHQLDTVINFDLPQVAEDYVHRIGRTGRAGAGGSAISLVSRDEVKQLRDIEKLIKQKIPVADAAKIDPVLARPAEALTELFLASPTPGTNNRSNSGSVRRRSGKSAAKQNNLKKSSGVRKKSTSGHSNKAKDPNEISGNQKTRRRRNPKSIN